MRLTVDKKYSTDIQDSVIQKILGMYSEEKLVDRPIFKDGFKRGTIEFEELRNESDKILIPWQMFLLEDSTLTEELNHIENLRLHKISEKLVSKRKGGGDITSKRILDRLIRCQNFLSESANLKKNSFCGSLKGKPISEAAKHVEEYFAIKMDSFRRKSKADALAYIIERFENGQINVCQGVLTNKILPALEDSREIYKNTSGFVIKDEKIPFVFIPSEINPNEREGRAILTLIYLIVLTGLDAYEYAINKDFKAQLLNAKGTERIAYDIVSEFLLPKTDSDKYQGQTITAVVRDFLSSKYKLSPTAVVVILRKRGLIQTQEEYESLLPEPAPPAKPGGHTPPIQSSVEKFNGKYVYESINQPFAQRLFSLFQHNIFSLETLIKRTLRNTAQISVYENNRQ